MDVSDVKEAIEFLSKTYRDPNGLARTVIERTESGWRVRFEGSDSLEAQSTEYLSHALARVVWRLRARAQAHSN